MKRPHVRVGWGLGVALAISMTTGAPSALAQTPGTTKTITEEQGNRTDLLPDMKSTVDAANGVTTVLRRQDTIRLFRTQEQTYQQVGSHLEDRTRMVSQWVPDPAPRVFLVGDLYTGAGLPASMWLSCLADGSFWGYGNNATHGTTLDVGAETRGILHNLLSTGNPSVVNMPITDHYTYIISETGEFIGSIPTTDVKANPSLGMAAHGSGNIWLTASTGGSLSYNGIDYPVLGTQLISPIAVDLNHDGKINVTGKATGFVRYDRKAAFNPQGAVSFDLKGQGKPGRFEWLTTDGDGLLVDDSKGQVTRAAQGNGVISGKDLFGGQVYGNGYVKLARLFGGKQVAYRANMTRQQLGFGPLKGDALKGLKVWVDANHDALVQPAELRTLASLGITEINAEYQVTRTGDDIRMVSSFVQNGKTYMSEDVWFAEDPADDQQEGR